VPAGQGDVAGHPSALLADRLLDDLDQDLLALLEQVLDLARVRDLLLGAAPARGLGGLAGSAARLLPGRALPLGLLALARLAVGRLLVLVVVAAVVALEKAAFVAGSENVADIEVGLLLDRLAQVDEGGLKTRENAAHAPLVEVAADASLARALEEILNEYTSFEDAEPCLGPLGGDHQLVIRHARSSESCVRLRSSATWMSRFPPDFSYQSTVR
jgi:hypothetical protein